MIKYFRLNRLLILSLLTLLANNSTKLYAQDSVVSIHFTRYYNDMQFVIVLKNDTCYHIDNIDRKYYFSQKSLTINEFRDWADFKNKCDKFIGKCSFIDSIPTLYPKFSKDTVVSELYIKTKDKIYFFKWTFSNETVKPYFKLNDYLEQCFYNDELLCKIYSRLIK